MTYPLFRSGNREAREIQNTNYFQGPNPMADNFYLRRQNEMLAKQNFALANYYTNNPRSNFDLVDGQVRGQVSPRVESSWKRLGAPYMFGNQPPAGPMVAFPQSPASMAMIAKGARNNAQQHNYVSYSPDYEPGTKVASQLHLDGLGVNPDTVQPRPNGRRRRAPRQIDPNYVPTQEDIAHVASLPPPTPRYEVDPRMRSMSPVDRMRLMMGEYPPGSPERTMMEGVIRMRDEVEKIDANFLKRMQEGTADREQYRQQLTDVFRRMLTTLPPELQKGIVAMIAAEQIPSVPGANFHLRLDATRNEFIIVDGPAPGPSGGVGSRGGRSRSGAGGGYSPTSYTGPSSSPGSSPSSGLSSGPGAKAGAEKKLKDEASKKGSETRLKERGAELDKLLGQLEDLQKSSKQASLDLQSFDAQHKKLTDNAQRARDRLEDVRKQMSDSRKEIAQIEKEHKEFSAKSLKRISELREIARKSPIDEAKKIVAQVNKINEDIDAHLVAANTRLKPIQERLEKITPQLAPIEKEFQDAQALAETNSGLLKKLIAQRDETAKQIAAMRKTIARLRTEIASR